MEVFGVRGLEVDEEASLSLRQEQFRVSHTEPAHEWQRLARRVRVQLDLWRTCGVHAMYVRCACGGGRACA